MADGDFIMLNTTNGTNKLWLTNYHNTLYTTLRYNTYSYKACGSGITCRYGKWPEIIY